MKKIILHGPATDNAGNYCDAGTALEVREDVEAGAIDKDRADDFLASGKAVSEAEAAEEGDGLDALKLAELRDVAETEEVALDGITTKADIAAAIRQTRLAKREAEVPAVPVLGADKIEGEPTV